MLRVSNGGATGAYTMLAAYNMVTSGLYDLMLVLGVEKALDCYDYEAESSTPAVVQTIGYSWLRLDLSTPGGRYIRVKGYPKNGRSELTDLLSVACMI